MAKPGEWRTGHYAKPTNDNEYFELMAKVIFSSGLNWSVIEKKWPGIAQAFAGFDIDNVAAYEEPDLDRLMQNPDIIRNHPKLSAVVGNAREFQNVIAESGSFAKYLKQLRESGGEEALRKDISRRFGFMGKGTTVIFLWSAGEELPKAHAEWDERHKA